MAHEEAFIPYLVGIGVRQISADPQFLPAVQKIVTGMNMSDAEAYAEALLSQSTLKGMETVMAREQWRGPIKSGD